jgi:hypothetical protein
MTFPFGVRLKDETRTTIASCADNIFEVFIARETQALIAVGLPGE